MNVGGSPKSPVCCSTSNLFGKQGKEGRGAWEAHHVNSSGGDGLGNCEILCWECHKKTRSFGR